MKLKIELKSRLFRLMICRQLPFRPQNDRPRLTNNDYARAYLLIKQSFWCLDLRDDSFIHDQAILT